MISCSLQNAVSGYCDECKAGNNLKLDAMQSVKLNSSKKNNSSNNWVTIVFHTIIPYDRSVIEAIGDAISVNKICRICKGNANFSAHLWKDNGIPL